MSIDERPKNVFLSWSGEMSRPVAEAMNEKLPTMIQAAVPWLSTRDIDAGVQWRPEIDKALADIRVGIFFLTPDNLNAPWILFEAGAMSRTVSQRTFVCTYLLGGLTPTEVKQPLAAFNHVQADKDGTRKLLGTVNKALGATITDAQLDQIYEKFWPELEVVLTNLKSPQGEPIKRSADDILAELLDLTRSIHSRIPSSKLKGLPLLGSEQKSLRDKLLRAYARDEVVLKGLGVNEPKRHRIAEYGTDRPDDETGDPITKAEV